MGGRPLLIGGSLLAGLGLGTLAALGVELIVRPLRGPQDIQSITGASPLGLIPTIEPSDQSAATDSWFPFGLFRRLRRDREPI